MLKRDALREALYKKGYQELRRAHEGNMTCTLMTDFLHVLILQEYDGGGADLYQPLVSDDLRNDIDAVILAIPERR